MNIQTSQIQEKETLRTLLQLEEGLRARRTALELVSRMMKHIHHQAISPHISPYLPISRA